MRDFTLEAVSFFAIFFSLAAILVFLSLSFEAASGQSDFWLNSQRAAVLVGERAMKGLLLTVLLGLGTDWCLKKYRKT